MPNSVSALCAGIRLIQDSRWYLMNKYQQSSSRIERTPEETHHGGQLSVGAPPLECNLWLEAELQRIDRIERIRNRQQYNHLYRPWLEQYHALRGYYPADPRRSFRAAVAGSLKRLYSRRS